MNKNKLNKISKFMFYDYDTYKNIIEIYELYQEFLKNYNKLNKLFELNNPVEIYIMFNFLLHNGYLYDKYFHFSSNATTNIKELLGSVTFTGKGVCRHISAMLTDILNDYGIEASQLAGYCDRYTVDIDVLNYQKYSRDELIEWLNKNIEDKDLYESILKSIVELVDNKKLNIEIYFKLIEETDKFIKLNGNHAITFAHKDSRNYFLDSTTSKIYRISEVDKKLLYRNEYDKIKIKLISSKILNSFSNYLMLIKRLSIQYPSISLEEENSIIEQTKDLCDNNIDTFEQFYNENSELYSEISNKVLSIKY